MSSSAEINCSICNKPVDLGIAKTDANGKAVHAQCYIVAVVAKQPIVPTNQPEAAS